MKAVALKEESVRAMSDAGVLLLVELRCSKYEKKFTNTTDTAESIWRHIHADFERAVQQGVLPPGDSRSMEALKKRFNVELGEFRQWCSVASRAIELSGVPAELVLEKVEAHQRPSTALFK